eukprot:1072302-Pleurochrysis_carterae.AAC.3
MSFCVQSCACACSGLCEHYPASARASELLQACLDDRPRIPVCPQHARVSSESVRIIANVDRSV